MKNLKLSKYWSANLLVLTGYIFTPIGIYLFFFFQPHIINSDASVFIWYDAILKYYGVYLPVFAILALAWWIQTSTDEDEAVENKSRIKQSIYKTGIFCAFLPLLVLTFMVLRYTIFFDMFEL